MPDNVSSLVAAAPDIKSEGLKSTESETATPISAETADLFLGILETQLPVPVLPEEAAAPPAELVVQVPELPQGGSPLPAQPPPVDPEHVLGVSREGSAPEVSQVEAARRPARLPALAAEAVEKQTREPQSAAAALRPAGGVTPEAARPADAVVQGLSASPERSAGSESPLRAEIPVRVESPRWGEALANRVTWSVRGGNQSAQLRLNPPELGPIEVKIALSNNEASINFGAQHAAVREAIELAMPRLREMLGQNGVTLGDVNVSSHSSDGGAGHAQDREGQSTDGYDGSAEDTAAASVDPATPGLAGEGLVDHYV